MNLVYVWNENYLNKEKYKQMGFCLSTKYEVKYDVEKNIISIAQNSDYISDFWGKNIFDVIAIVGDNGAGKTMLLNYLIDIFKAINLGNSYDMDFFVIFEDGDRLKVLVTTKYMDVEVCSDINKEIIPMGSMSNYNLSTYRFGYFTNALSLNDYLSVRSPHIYDASMGGLIKNIANEDQEMYYKKVDEDNIQNYFTNQFRRVIEFLYRQNFNDVAIGFRWPKRVNVFINKSNASDEYIGNALDKMRENNKELDRMLPKQNFRVKNYLIPLTKKYPLTWTSNLAISLITNLFREFCIPQTTSEKKDREAVAFLKFLEDFKKRRKWEDTIYKEIIVLINELKEILSKSYRCKKYMDFILWLEKNEKYVNEGCENNPNCCSILLDDEHRDFVMELLEHYKNTNFAFPYFIFRLGLSTGELNFLNLYVNMYNMLSINQKEKPVVTNSLFSGTIECTNILLAFDEADLSLHPKWQQKYVYWLLEFIKSVFPMCQVHVIIATHSPIMLSDFPDDNILYLDDECIETKRDIKTFGSNIHDLFLDSFFLSSKGTIGEFAEQKIKEIVNQLNNKELSDIEQEKILKIIECVGDDIVRNKLLQLYNQKSNKSIVRDKKEKDLNTIDMTINMLKMQKEQIEHMIEELEQKKK